MAVELRSTLNRQPIHVGHRVLCGRWGTGVRTLKVSFEEFFGSQVRGHLEAKRIEVVRFWPRSLMDVYLSGGVTAVREALEAPKPAAPSTDTPKPEKPAPGPAAGAPPATEPPSGEKESEPPAGDLDPAEASHSEADEPPAWTREELEALPWSGDGSIREVASALGVSGRNKGDIVEAILALRGEE